VHLLVPTILICLYIPAHTLELGAYNSKKVFRWIVAHKCKTCSDSVVRLCLAAWVNRFANAGDAAVEAAGNTMERVLLF
jgi:hypothetical protein